MMFDHVMAKLAVNLTFRNQWSGTPAVESVIVPAKSVATGELPDENSDCKGRQFECEYPSYHCEYSLSEYFLSRKAFNKSLLRLMAKLILIHTVGTLC